MTFFICCYSIVNWTLKSRPSSSKWRGVSCGMSVKGGRGFNALTHLKKETTIYCTPTSAGNRSELHMSKTSSVIPFFVHFLIIILEAFSKQYDKCNRIRKEITQSFISGQNTCSVSSVKQSWDLLLHCTPLVHSVKSWWLQNEPKKH